MTPVPLPTPAEFDAALGPELLALLEAHDAVRAELARLTVETDPGGEDAEASAEGPPRVLARRDCLDELHETLAQALRRRRAAVVRADVAGAASRRPRACPPRSLYPVPESPPVPNPPADEACARRPPDPARIQSLRATLDALDEAHQALQDARRQEPRPGTGDERAARYAVTAMREQLWSRARARVLALLDDPAGSSSGTRRVDGPGTTTEPRPDPDVAARRFDLAAATLAGRPEDLQAGGELSAAARAWAAALCAAEPTPFEALFAPPGVPSVVVSRTAGPGGCRDDAGEPPRLLGPERLDALDRFEIGRRDRAPPRR